LAEFKESAEYKQGLQDYLDAMGFPEERVALTIDTKNINGVEYIYLIADIHQKELTSISDIYKDLFKPVKLFEYQNGLWVRMYLGNANPEVRIGSTGKYDLESIFHDYYGNYSGGWAHAMVQSHPKEDIYDTQKIINEANMAQRVGPLYQAYHLVWGYQDQLPEWIKELAPKITNDELLNLLMEHVHNLVEDGVSRVDTYSVVNEPLGSKLNKPHLFTRLGINSEEHANWIGKLFIEAEETAASLGYSPSLILNDTQIEFGGTKADLIFEIVKKMKGDSIPIDGIGFQMHINAIEFDMKNLPQKIDLLIEQIKRYQEIGVEVWISEMDVNIDSINSKDRYLLQAFIYQKLIKACLESGVTNITFFSGIDENSWLIESYGLEHPDPTLMTFQGPKIAWYQVLRLLADSR